MQRIPGSVSWELQVAFTMSLVFILGKLLPISIKALLDKVMFWLRTKHVAVLKSRI